MLIRNIRFNYAVDQSGLRNFDGKGYPYHDYLHGIGLDFKGSSFTAKTTTLPSRLGERYKQLGSMDLREDGMTPREFKPKCIHVSLRSFFKGAALNAVGLAGPGIEALLAKRIWQQYPESFTISIMSVGATLRARLTEIKVMAQLLASESFDSEFGVQINITCPNVDHEENLSVLIQETRESSAIVRYHLGDRVPITFKINALLPVDVGVEMSEGDPNCDGLCNSNTIAWRDVPPLVRLELFGTTESPLASFGGGGLSGAQYLFELTEKWVRKARSQGLKKPIIAGGGILKPVHVDMLAAAGASGIGIGSVAFLRPWRVRGIIDRANELGRLGKFYSA